MLGIGLIGRRIVLTFAGFFLFGNAAQAEVQKISFARQFGLQNLALVVMEKHKLIEKHAKAANVQLEPIWRQFGSGAAMNEGLISGALDVAVGGTAPLAIIWDRTRSNLAVKGIAAICDAPMILLSRNPSFKTLEDITPRDRIALPAVKTSMQAVTLQMASAKAFGAEQFSKLDSQTVSMSHPDAFAAFMSGKLEVNGHFSSPPYYYKELADASVHRVLDSFEVFGGSATLVSIYATAKFHDANPGAMKIVLAALDDAIGRINKDRRQAVLDYMDVTNEKLDQFTIDQFVSDKQVAFKLAPTGILEATKFLHQIGTIKTLPSSWKDLFFPLVHDQSGN